MADETEAYEGSRYASHVSIVRNEDACIACNRCVDVCMQDVHVPNPEEGRPPLVYGTPLKRCVSADREVVGRARVGRG